MLYGKTSHSYCCAADDSSEKNEPGKRLIELLERVVLISVRPFFKILFS
jgi:hypothetical protein